MSTFHHFATAIYRRFEAMSSDELFVAGAPDEDIFARYLAAFPPGSTPNL